jgi:hypothetical protein
MEEAGGAAAEILAIPIEEHGQCYLILLHVDTHAFRAEATVCVCVCMCVCACVCVCERERERESCKQYSQQREDFFHFFKACLAFKKVEKGN